MKYIAGSPRRQTFHDSEAEQAVIGSLLIQPERFEPVSRIVGPLDFVDQLHSTIFKEMQVMRASGEPIDHLLLLSRLNSHDGIAAHLAKCASSVPHARHAEQYASRIADLALRRKLIDLGLYLRDAPTNGKAPSEILADVGHDLEQLQRELSGRNGQARPSTIQPVCITELGDGEAVDWLWHGWVARGFTTLVIGLWKAGKTTLVSHLLRAMEHGGNIAGTIQPAKVLVISEEGAGLWARRRDDIGIGSNVKLLIRPFKQRATLKEWQRFMGDVAQTVASDGYDLVVVDTWSSVSPVINENDAAETMAALLPLHAVTAAGAGVLLLHHPRKGDASEGQASRGSGALTGHVDTIIELRRYDPQSATDRRRKLRGLGRFDETSPEVVIELGDEGYVTLGDVGDAKQSDRWGTIADLLDGQQGMTAEELRESWPEPKPAIRTIRNDLRTGHEAGRFGRPGSGKRGDPATYSITAP